jgi:hypothetical protein
MVSRGSGFIDVAIKGRLLNDSTSDVFSFDKLWLLQ